MRACTILTALLVIPAVVLWSQETPPQSEEVYRSAYQTAKQDGVITDDEQQMLNAIRESLGLSQDAIMRIHQVQDAAQVPRLNQSGRWPLVAQNMVYAASIYGWGIPYVLGTEDFKWIVGSEMMSLGAAYYLTYRVTKNMEISHARAQMMRTGSAVGVAYALGVNTLFELDDEKGRLWAWVVMASVPVGTYAGDKVFARWNPSHGQAWSLSIWVELGSYTMRQIHRLIQEEPQEPFVDWWEDEQSPEYEQWEQEHNDWEKPNVLFSMAGFPLGAYLGHRFLGTRQYSFGDAMMLLQGRWVGWFYGMLTGDALNLDMDDSGSRILRVAGSVAGTVMMDRMVRGYDYSFGEAALTALGTLSGGAFAVGVSVIAEIREGETVDILVMLGSAAGFFLGKSILTPKLEKRTESQARGPTFSVLPGFIPQGRRLQPAVHLSFRF